MRADGAAGARVRERIQSSARTTAVISVAAVLISVLSLFLILRENRRQRQIAEMSRRSAEQAELASRAKSRFLTMMSHELRNPLNGVLGPLALLGQSDIAERQQRLVGAGAAVGPVHAADADRACSTTARCRTGAFQLRSEPFRVAALADAVRDALRAEGAGGATVAVLPGTPERMHGDLDRLRQVFVHLALYMLEGRDAGEAARPLRPRRQQPRRRDRRRRRPASAIDWKLDLLMGLSEIAPGPGDRGGAAAADRPRPDLGLRRRPDPGRGRDGSRGRSASTIPAEPVRFEQIRVHLETRSAALATIYQAALSSDRVAFVAAGSRRSRSTSCSSTAPASARLPLMSRLRARFPGALFVSLGLPQTPGLLRRHRRDARTTCRGCAPASSAGSPHRAAADCLLPLARTSCILR